MRKAAVVGAGKIGSTVASLLAGSGDYEVLVVDQSAEALADATVFDIHTGKGQGSDLAASSRAVACLQLTA